MSWSRRRVLVVLTAVAALAFTALLQTAFGQRKVVLQPGPGGVPIVFNPVQPAGSADAASFDLPKDAVARRRIEAARDYIEAKRWEEVVRALQDILDDPQDKFAPLLRKGPDGKEVEVPTSVRAEANRLLSGLPKEGLEVYKAYGEAGPKAAEYLKKAKDATTTEERVALLGLVVRNYLHTDAGGEAADLLATHSMDRGDFRTAARFYSLLLTRAGGADELPPETLFRAAYAYNQTGDRAGEDLIWQAARARGIREIKFGDDATKSVSDLQDYLAGVVPAVEAVGRQWSYFLGDVARTGKGEGGPAFMLRGWAQPTIIDQNPTTQQEFGEKVGDLFKKATEAIVRTNQPVLPPQFPVTATVTLKSDGMKHSLVVFRTHSGIVAYDLRPSELSKGRIIGMCPMKGTLDWMMSGGNQGTFSQWTQAYVEGNQRPGILFENTTIGTLSVDGDFAYTVEDLAVPPPPQYRLNVGFPGNPNGSGFPTEIFEAVKHSELMAYDLSSGCKAVWTPPRPEEKSELADSYFLGPPLAVNGKLYVLAEKQQELRLICLENVKGDTANTWKPKVDFVLPLGTARDSRLDSDVLRRVNAAHLSYGEGVLVCPTNLGYVIGIDLLQNSLLWAYPYRDKADETAAGNPMQPRGMPPGMVFPNGMPVQLAPPQQGWKVSAPIIQNGKVVFTAPDSKSVHCVNLRDGTPAWSRPRQEGDLYLGGVVDGRAIVVGTRVVRAYEVATGDEAWKVEAGMPSGFGAASDSVYYVPLKESVANKQPEICAIDVDRGVVIGHSKARQAPMSDKPLEPPGNLVFFDGAIISQSNDEVAAYPQLKVKIAQMTEALKNNPNDANGLFDRGEMSLEEGALENAVQDFRRVLQNNPPADLAAHTKAHLYDALTEYFQYDFDNAEKYQEDYAALCAPDLSPTATDAQKAEARRRRTNFLYLLAKGKEGQRKLTEAFDLYLQLNAEAPPNELLSLVDERLAKAAPDVLAQGRIAAMTAGASEEERRPLEARIASRWKEIQGKDDVDELRKFVTLFGSLFGVGQEARLQLAERLMQETAGPKGGDEPDPLIDAERQLGLLRARTEDPELAARAVECLARLNMRRGMLDDAAYYFRVLRDRYPAVKVKDGKTGADLFNETATDKRLWSQLDEPPPFGEAGRLHAEAPRGNYPYVNQVYQFAQEGEPLPFFRRYGLGLGLGDSQLRLIDRTDPAAVNPLWKPFALAPAQTGFQLIVNANVQVINNPAAGAFIIGPGGMQVANAQPLPSPKFSFVSLGHLVALPVGHMVYGVDAATGRQLWAMNLFKPVNQKEFPSAGADAPTLLPGSLTVDPRDGGAQIAYADGWTQRLGQAVPLGGGAVCLQMKDALAAVDPVSGRVLWARSDVSPRSHVFGDDQHVFVVEMSPEGKPAQTRVLRSYDGATVKPAPKDFRLAYEGRVRLVGRDILVADKDKDATTLRLYDPLTGQDVWKQAFAPKSVVMQGDEGDLAGVVEPDGRVRVVDLTTRQEVLTPLSKIAPEHLEKDATYAVLGDAANVYILPNAADAGGVRMFPNLMPGTGLRGLNVNGRIYAFRRVTGARAWEADVANQQLVLNQFREMPVLFLTGTTAKGQAGFVPNQAAPETSVQIRVKRTGKLLVDEKENGSRPFHALELNAPQGRIDFTNPQERISITVENGEKPAADEGP